MEASTLGQLTFLVWGLFCVGVMTAAVLLVRQRILANNARELIGYTRQITAQLTKKTELLHRQSDSYFSTLMDAGFPRLSALEADLTEIAIVVEELAKSSSIAAKSEACKVCSYVLNPDLPPPPTVFVPQQLLLRVRNWDTTAERLFLNCAQQLEEAYERENDCGISRETRKRNDTFTTIQELRRALLL